MVILYCQLPRTIDSSFEILVSPDGVFAYLWNFSMTSPVQSPSAQSPSKQHSYVSTILVLFCIVINVSVIVTRHHDPPFVVRLNSRQQDLFCSNLWATWSFETLYWRWFRYQQSSWLNVHWFVLPKISTARPACLIVSVTAESASVDLLFHLS